MAVQPRRRLYEPRTYSAADEFAVWLELAQSAPANNANP
jgi:hypothetical protein